MIIKPPSVGTLDPLPHRSLWAKAGQLTKLSTSHFTMTITTDIVNPEGCRKVAGDNIRGRRCTMTSRLGGALEHSASQVRPGRSSQSLPADLSAIAQLATAEALAKVGGKKLR